MYRRGMRRWVVLLLAAGCTAGPPSVTVDPTSAPPATTGMTAGTAPGTTDGTTDGTAPAPTAPGTTTTTPPPGTVVVTSLVTSVVTSLIPAPTTTARPTTTTAPATTTTAGATTTTKPGPIPYTGNLTGDEQAAFYSIANWQRLTLDAGLMSVAKRVGKSPTAWSATGTSGCFGNAPQTTQDIVSSCRLRADITHIGLSVTRNGTRTDVFMAWGVWP